MRILNYLNWKSGDVDLMFKFLKMFYLNLVFTELKHLMQLLKTTIQ